MAQEGITISVRVLDNFSKPLNDLRKSLESLKIPKDFQAAVISLSKNFKQARGEVDLFRLSMGFIEKLTTGASLAAAGAAIEAIGDSSKISTAFISNFSKILKGVGVIAIGLLAIDIINFFLSIGNAAEQAAQKIRDDFNTAIAEIDGNTAATQALVSQYIALREKANLTAAEQSVLAELAERLAEKFPELGDHEPFPLWYNPSELLPMIYTTDCIGGAIWTNG